MNFNKKIIRVALALGVVLVIFTVVYATVYNRSFDAVSIEKVIENQKQDEISRQFCSEFQMSVAEFSSKLNGAKGLWSYEVHDYDWFPCYYKAAISGKEYRLRLGGLVEIWSPNGELEKYLHWNEGK